MRGKMWTKGLVWLVGAGALVGMAACGGDAIGPSARHNVSLSVALAGGATSGSGAVSPALDVSQSSGDTTLVLQDVSLVMDRIELRGTTDSCGAAEDSAEAASDSAASDSADAAGSASADGPAAEAHHGSYGEQGDGCGVVQAGPLLVHLPLDSAVTHVAQLELPAGTYEKLEYRVHPPTAGDSADAGFLSEHPDLEGVSLRVTGTWNGQAFTFEQGIDAGQEIRLQPPLEVSDTTTSANVTLTFDVRSWFEAPDGSLIDPSTAGEGGANAEIVAENIRRSMESSHCFEDSNHDGHADSGGAPEPTGG